MTSTVQALADEHVRFARIFHTKDPDAPPQLFVSASRGYVYGGPDSALEALEACLLEEVRHLAKTASEPAD